MIGVRAYNSPIGSPPANGLHVDGNVSIGTLGGSSGWEPGSELSVSGGASIGPDFAEDAAPLDGMIIQGTVGIGTRAPTYKLHVNGTVAAIGLTFLSSREYKKEIQKIGTGEHQKMLSELMNVDITTYKYKENFGGDDQTKLGFIAEEMPKEVLSKDGKGVDVYALLAYTIGALKAQQKEIEELKALVNAGQ